VSCEQAVRAGTRETALDMFVWDWKQRRENEGGVTRTRSTRKSRSSQKHLPHRNLAAVNGERGEESDAVSSSDACPPGARSAGQVGQKSERMRSVRRLWALAKP
jgi:hypothetical protein